MFSTSRDKSQQKDALALLPIVVLHVITTTDIALSQSLTSSQIRRSPSFHRLHYLRQESSWNSHPSLPGG